MEEPRSRNNDGFSPPASQVPEKHAALILAALSLADDGVRLACETRDPYGPVEVRRALVEHCEWCPLLALCRAAGEGEQGVWGGVDLGIK